MTKILSFGSLNVDYVYRVPHVVAPGETLQSHSLAIFPGGKGANQSVAIARAGAPVLHAGKVGRDGAWLRQRLATEGVGTRHVRTGEGHTGHAIIQVDDEGQNAIVLDAGSNREITPRDIDHVVADAQGCGWLLLQNEISNVAHLIRVGHAHGLKICLNPAPLDAALASYPLELVDLLVVNEVEGHGLAGGGRGEEILDRLAGRWRGVELILTLGRQGSLYRGPGGETLVQPAIEVEAVDTTAAGDTFVGYFLACRTKQLAVAESLAWAARAAALCVTRRGALDSIPRWDEVAAARL